MLLDKYMPEWDKYEIHKRVVKYPLSQCYPIVSKVNWEGSITSNIYKQGLKIINIFKKEKLEVKDLQLSEFIRGGFFVLEDNGVDEIVIGSYMHINGKTSGKIITEQVTLEDYLNFNQKYCYKLTWNVRVHRVDKNNTMITTESRIKSCDLTTKRLFSIYWFLIRLVSGMTRIDFLRTLEKQIIEKMIDRNAH